MSGSVESWLIGFLSLWTLGAAGCGQDQAGPAGKSPPGVATSHPAALVSGTAALEEVRRFVALGSRDAGTPGAEKSAAYLLARLKEIGAEAEIQEFREASPKGETMFRNVLGRIPGGSGPIVLLGGHYDTKTGIDGFEGANDSGSSTGLLLELARAFVQQAPAGVDLRFAFFDGEEAMVEYGPTDGFHGSEHLAKSMLAEGTLTNVAAMILLDMVGDKDLTVTIPRNSMPWLTALAFDAARAEGTRRHFSLSPYAIGDDHEAFAKRGAPAIDLIDFEFGGAPGKNDYWHTPQDTLDKLSAESLETVGRVAARMVAEVARKAQGEK